MIIFLNGTSSAGKTSIAVELQQRLNAPFLRVGIDNFLGMCPVRYFGVDPAPGDAAYEGLSFITKHGGSHTWFELSVGPIGLRFGHGVHRAIAALAAAGNSLIVDEVLFAEHRLVDYLKLLRGMEVLFVGVRCPLSVLEQRERDRGDRQLGQARGQFEKVHAHGLYDLEVDTSLASTVECAKRIMHHIDTESPMVAFDQLWATFAAHSQPSDAKPLEDSTIATP